MEVELYKDFRGTGSGGRGQRRQGWPLLAAELPKGETSMREGQGLK